MLLTTCKKQHGFSLIEVLIGLTISTIIAVAALALFTTTISSSEQVLKKGKLDRDLYAVMDVIVFDIQRAGYWDNATSSKTGNPFMVAGTTDITVNAATNCITFSYDTCTSATPSTCLDSDAVVEDNEKFGYRLNPTTLNAIQFRPAGSAATFDCATVASNWTNLTDPNVIKITAFTVTKSNVAVNPGSGTDTINYRTVTVSISAQLVNDTSVTKTITRSIKVYNDKYLP